MGDTPQVKSLSIMIFLASRVYLQRLSRCLACPLQLSCPPHFPYCFYAWSKKELVFPKMDTHHIFSLFTGNFSFPKLKVYLQWPSRCLLISGCTEEFVELLLACALQLSTFCHMASTSGLRMNQSSLRWIPVTFSSSPQATLISYLPSAFVVPFLQKVLSLGQELRHFRHRSFWDLNIIIFHQPGYLLRHAPLNRLIVGFGCTLIVRYPLCIYVLYHCWDPSVEIPSSSCSQLTAPPSPNLSN